MKTVQLETAGPLGILILANLPLNLSVPLTGLVTRSRRHSFRAMTCAQA